MSRHALLPMRFEHSTVQFKFWRKKGLAAPVPVSMLAPCRNLDSDVHLQAQPTSVPQRISLGLVFSASVQQSANFDMEIRPARHNICLILIQSDRSAGNAFKRMQQCNGRPGSLPAHCGNAPEDVRKSRRCCSASSPTMLPHEAP